VIVPLLVGVLAALAFTLPLAWKWELGVARVGVAVALLGVVASTIVTLLGIDGFLAAVLVAVLAVGAATGLLAWRFYRDPDRVAPAQPGAVVSPADGEVLYVRRSEGGVVPVSTKHGRDYRLEELTHTPLATEDAVVVGIAMSFLDVHVNRAPIAGTVTLQRHFPGLFGSLKDPENMLRNERATTVIQQGGNEVAMVQIASRLVRQIASYVREGQPVALGDRVGVIRLGSQVDLVLPLRNDLEVLVRPGEHVRAGETVVATFAVASKTPWEPVRESLSAS
jgi:phosphatidylserine decarboxylase